ncbi:GTP-binding protein [Desulfosporosinus sp. BG]|uniref:CobW family GTP-binding protein n=1 Tax=Desulfosporosinus sp. BG TaxID=1633135 RepID=UPI000857168B|nr:GTP-binding protein [Desulfosporosinus sp. BG]ODA39296.1 putative metal chaperone, involved in Zn homeostasis, GTPase of COG0523 family [Desulfosporosinus sp. BG]
MMIKVDIISGFLGSGKTTLVKKLLQVHQQENVVLIENEFGDIGIDGELIEREGFEVFEISSGCICCIMQKDFVQMLARIIKEFHPQRIIIEPTGISILSEIIDILRKPEFAALLEINSLVTVVDCVNYLQQCEIFGEFFEDQITNASFLTLSKSQLVESETVDKIITSLREFNQDAEIINKPWDSLGPAEVENLLDGQADLDFSDILHTEYKPCSENEFQTLALKTSRAFSQEELELILSLLGQPQYGQVLRGKGFLKSPQGFLDFSYTNGQFMVSPSKFNSSGKLCLIGKNLKQQEIKNLFKIKSEGMFSWLKF